MIRYKNMAYMNVLLQNGYIVVTFVLVIKFVKFW
jgi:hypothetical protein